DAFDDEFLNINLALEMCLTSTQGSERWKIGFRILDNFHRYFMLHGQFHYAAEHIAQARASIEDYEKKGNALDKETLRLKAGIYSLTGSLAWGLGNYREGGDWHGKAYSIHEALADEAGMAEALNNWAVNLGMLGENQTALEKHERGLALYRKIGDRWGEAKQLNNLGNLLHVMGREEVAVATFEQALAIARELKDAFFTSSLLCNIAHLRVHAGDYAAAISLLNDGAESTNKAETPYLRAWSLVILTLAYLKQDQVEVAIHTLQEGIELLPNLTDMSLKVEYLKTSVYALAYSGYPMDAVQLFSTVTKICEELGLSEYPPDEAELREFIQTLRSKMSAEAISTAEQKGRDFTFDSAFAFIVEKLNPPAPPPPSPELEQVLTTREREVLVLLSKGMTNEEISRELVVVIKTVEKHVANILMKLGMKNRTEAAAWAVERGIK
ncbi:MAG: tetratricopeptide repeat protein, partial [Chloroflexi bacterium]|nr:tetratricopeptide repeat protein [Chloroflexota bacterium]